MTTVETVDVARRPHRSRTLAPAEGGAPVGFRSALASEWVKFRSADSLRWTLLAAALTMPAIAVFVGATESLQPDDTILGASLTGAVVVQMIAAALGALVMTTEYTSGAIRTTLVSVPRRVPVLAAKATVVTGALFAVALPAATVSYLIGRVTLDTDSYASGDPWPALAGVATLLALTGVLGLAIGTVLRRSAGAVAAVVGVLLLPDLFGPLFGDFQPWVGGAAPSGVMQKITQTSDVNPEMVGTLGGGPSVAVVAAYVLVALAGSAWLLRSRDV